MNMNLFFQNICKQKIRCALPILSFPAIQQLSVSVNETLHSAELQAKVMEVIAQQTDTIAAVSLMDLSLEAEAFGAQIIFHEDEVPSITGQLITSEEDANKLQEELQEKYPEAEFTVIYGGQPVYYYIISLE